MRPIATVNRMLLTEAKTRDEEQSSARLRDGSHAELGDLQNAHLRCRPLICKSWLNTLGFAYYRTSLPGVKKE